MTTKNDDDNKDNKDGNKDGKDDREYQDNDAIDNFYYTPGNPGIRLLGIFN